MKGELALPTVGEASFTNGDAHNNAVRPMRGRPFLHDTVILNGGNLVDD
jgi:hypothetical protein